MENTLELTVQTHHEKVEICKVDHPHKVFRAPSADGKVMEIYCPKCFVQYTQPMTRAERKLYG